MTKLTITINNLWNIPIATFDFNRFWFYRQVEMPLQILLNRCSLAHKTLQHFFPER